MTKEGGKLEIRMSMRERVSESVCVKGTSLFFFLCELRCAFRALLYRNRNKNKSKNKNKNKNRNRKRNRNRNKNRN